MSYTMPIQFFCKEHKANRFDASAVPKKSGCPARCRTATLPMTGGIAPCGSDRGRALSARAGSKVRRNLRKRTHCKQNSDSNVQNKHRKVDLWNDWWLKCLVIGCLFGLFLKGEKFFRILGRLMEIFLLILYLQAMQPNFGADALLLPLLIAQSYLKWRSEVSVFSLILCRYATLTSAIPCI